MEKICFIIFKSMDNKDIRWIQRLNSYIKALKQLENAVKLSRIRDLSDLEKQGLIQSFEFTHELAWNTIKDFFKYRGNNQIFGSKDAVREAFSYGLIEDGGSWMKMIQSRNQSSHTYNEKTAEDIIESVVQQFYGEFEKFSIKMRQLAEQEK